MLAVGGFDHLDERHKFLVELALAALTSWAWVRGLVAIQAPEPIWARVSRVYVLGFASPPYDEPPEELRQVEQ